MKTINIKKVSEDWGGDNLLFTIHIDEEEYINILKNNIEDIDNILFKINNDGELDLEWDFEISYGNMDYNGYFFKTVFIDKDDLLHKIDDDEIVVDEYLIDFVEEDCDKLIHKLFGDEDE